MGNTIILLMLLYIVACDYEMCVPLSHRIGDPTTFHVMRSQWTMMEDCDDSSGSKVSIHTSRRGWTQTLFS